MPDDTDRLKNACRILAINGSSPEIRTLAAAQVNANEWIDGSLEDTKKHIAQLEAIDSRLETLESRLTLLENRL